MEALNTIINNNINPAIFKTQLCYTWYTKTHNYTCIISTFDIVHPSSVFCNLFNKNFISTLQTDATSFALDLYTKEIMITFVTNIIINTTAYAKRTHNDGQIKM